MIVFAVVCSELQERVRGAEEQLKGRCEEVEALKVQLAQVQQDAQEQVLVEVQAPLQSAAPQVFNMEPSLEPEVGGRNLNAYKNVCVQVENSEQLEQLKNR